jgi:hypothetical protein
MIIQEGNQRDYVNVFAMVLTELKHEGVRSDMVYPSRTQHAQR